MRHRIKLSFILLQKTLLLSIVVCFLVVSGCSSQSSEACSSQPISMQFYWVCDSNDLTVSHNATTHDLTYQGRPVCLVQPPVLTSQSFKTITDESRDGMVWSTVTLTAEAAKAFGKSTASQIGRVLATVLIEPVASEDPDHSSGSACGYQTVVLNLATVQSALDGVGFTVSGFESHKQLQRLIDSVQH